MRVLLIELNYDSHITHPPLGLGYLASSLEKDRHKVSIYDGTLRNAKESDYINAIKMFDADLVGISVMTRGHIKAKNLISAIKVRFDDFPVVVGGPQVTAYPEIVLADLNADFAVIGEGEITLCELVERIEANKKSFEDIAGLVHKDKQGSVYRTKPRELIKDLDSLPFPAWHHMPPSEYRIVPILAPVKALPVAPIITSRGCPYDCSFCASNATWRRKLRLRSKQNVIEEIRLLVKEYGVKEIHISDDNFTADTGRAGEICDAIIESDISISWQCPNGVRIDRLDSSLLKKMRRSGCYAVGLGIESGNSAVLRSVDKKLDLSIVRGVLQKLRKVGILSYGFFILGLPGENRKTLEDTVNFALKNSFDRAWFNIFTPYPGSRAFRSWLGNRSFADIDWNSHDCNTAVATIDDVTPEELEDYQRYAVRRFYLRPRVLLSLLLHLRLKEVLTLIRTRFFRKYIRACKSNLL